MDTNNVNKEQTLDSREVAEMANETHGNLCRKIRQYIQYMTASKDEINIDSIFKPTDFFIESSYTDAYGRSKPCYRVTKKGCEMIAHKMTGQKGVLFTAAYVTAFHEMTERAFPAMSNANSSLCAVPIEHLDAVVRLMKFQRRVMLDMGCTPMEVGAMVKGTMDAYSVPVTKAFSKQIDGQLCLFDAPLLRLEA